MPSFSRFALGAALLLSTAGLAFPQDNVGDILYLEGTVTVVRNGAEVAPADLMIGMPIENFDQIQTGDDGKMQIEVSTPKAPRMTLNISPNTQFSLELNTLSSQQQSSVGLQGGTIALKVAKLTSAQAVNVISESTACGVKGTDFMVTVPPTGDVLVTCSDGDVECTDDDGKVMHALPGTAVEKLPGESYGTLAINGGSLEDFRKNWEVKRVAVLRSNALGVFRKNALAYENLVQEFNRNYRELMLKEKIFQKWYAEEKKHRMGSAAEIRQETTEITEVLSRLRETQFLLERVDHRLSQLKKLHDQGVGKGTIREGLTTMAFFDRFEKERKVLELQLAAVRHVVKLFASRNGGYDPTHVIDIKRLKTNRMGPR